MLLVLKPGSEHQARAIFKKWELDFAIIGKLTETGRMVLHHKGEVIANLPIDPLALASPEYGENERPWDPTPVRQNIKPNDTSEPEDPLAILAFLMGTPDLASKRWIWEQYDYLVMGDTLQRPGGDAAVVRIQNTKKAIAMTTDCTPRYCMADPVEGGKQAVAEAWRCLLYTSDAADE